MNSLKRQIISHLFWPFFLGYIDRDRLSTGFPFVAVLEQQGYCSFPSSCSCTLWATSCCYKEYVLVLLRKVTVIDPNVLWFSVDVLCHDVCHPLFLIGFSVNHWHPCSPQTLLGVLFNSVTQPAVLCAPLYVLWFLLSCAMSHNSFKQCVRSWHNRNLVLGVSGSFPSLSKTCSKSSFTRMSSQKAAAEDQSSISEGKSVTDLSITEGYNYNFRISFVFITKLCSPELLPNKHNHFCLVGPVHWPVPGSSPSLSVSANHTPDPIGLSPCRGFREGSLFFLRPLAAKLPQNRLTQYQSQLTHC